MALSALANLAVYRHNIFKVARETESLALEASARSFREDAGVVEK